MLNFVFKKFHTKTTETQISVPTRMICISCMYNFCCNHCKKNKVRKKSIKNSCALEDPYK